MQRIAGRILLLALGLAVAAAECQGQDINGAV
jgi:hypothetical protein